MHHLQIKIALGISGVLTKTSTWRGEFDGEKAQLDLVIDRRDQVINLLEIKFSTNEYKITNDYEKRLQKKISTFQGATKSKKALLLTLLTTFGTSKSRFSAFVHKELTMDALFEQL